MFLNSDKEVRVKKLGSTFPICGVEEEPVVFQIGPAKYSIVPQFSEQVSILGSEKFSLDSKEVSPMPRKLV